MTPMSQMRSGPFTSRTKVFSANFDTYMCTHLEGGRERGDVGGGKIVPFSK